MNDSGDYSVRKSGSSPEVWGASQISDDGADARARNRAKRNAQRKKKKDATPVEDEAPADETDDPTDETDDNPTVDHLA